MKCPYCGKEVEEGSKFCDGCGAKLDETREVEKTYDYVYEQPKKSKAGLIAAIIIISVLVVAGIIVGIVLINNGDKEKAKDNKIIDKKEVKKENPIDSLKYTEHLLENGDLILIVENKGKSDVSATFEVEYYNEENTVVDSNSESLIGLPSGEKTALRVYRTDRQYKDYKIKIESLNSTAFKAYNKDVKISSKDDKEEEEIVVTFTNNSEKTLDSARVAVVFYKDGKMIGYGYDAEYDVDANKSVAMYVYYPYGSGYNTLEFDSYEVYLVEAYAYTF